MVEYSDSSIEDGPELDTMARICWEETFAHSCSADDMAAYFSQAYGPDGALLRDLASPAHRFRIARHQGAIIGYAKLSDPWLPAAFVGPNARQLSQLYVASAHHGTGIAQVLMSWAIDIARKAGADELLLTVWEVNDRAKRFYDRYGFVHIGDYAFQTGNQTDRDLIMRLAL